MSAGTLGRGVFEFLGDDRDFQAVSNRVEKRFVDTIGKFKLGFIGAAFVNTAASAMARFAKEAEDAATKLRLGTISAGEFVEETARGVPIIGHFVSAGRSIREVVTGENALTESIKRQTIEQEKRIALMALLIQRFRELQRAHEDARAALDFHVGDSPFVHAAGGVITKGLRAGEDAKAVAEADKKALAAIEEQRKDLLSRLDFANDTSLNASLIRKFGPSSKDDAETLKSELRKLEGPANELRAKIAQARKDKEEFAGRGTFTALTSLVGSEVGKAVSKVGDVVEVYMTRVRTMQDATREGLDSMVSDWQKFQNKMAAFQLDFSKGLINPKQLGALQNKATLDAAFKPIEDFFRAKFAAFGASVLQTVNFGPFFKVGQQLQTMFSDFGDRRKPAPEFRARTVSLEGLGAGIQEAAASRVKDVQDKQLEQAKALVDLTKQLVTSVNAVVTNTKGPRYAVVGP